MPGSQDGSKKNGRANAHGRERPVNRGTCQNGFRPNWLTGCRIGGVTDLRRRFG